MAKGKKTEEPEVEAPVAENTESLDNAAPEAISETGARKEAEEGKAPEEPENPGLSSISELAVKHRLPGWQTAAILRMMDWEDDVMISEAEFRSAIDKLSNRRIGGGR